MVFFKHIAPSKLTDCKRIAIMRLSALGDIFNLLPIINLICKNYPNLEVTWIIGKNEAYLFQHFAKQYPNLKLYVFNKAVPYTQAIKEMRSLTSKPFDLLFQAQTSLRSNILVKFIKAKQTIGFCSKRAFNLQRFFVNKQIPNQTSMHVMFDYWDLFKDYLSSKDWEDFAQLGVVDSTAIYNQTYPEHLKQQTNLKPLFNLGLGLAGSTEAKSYIQSKNLAIYEHLYQLSHFCTDTTKVEKVAEVEKDTKVEKDAEALKDHQVTSEQTRTTKLVVLSPASSALHKNWTAQGYATLIHDILAKGHYCIVTGSNKDTEVAVVKAALECFKKEFSHNLSAEQKDKLIILSNRTNLLELVLFLELADLVISPDSGPMHLASCLGIPTIGLFAYLNPYRSGPIQGLADVVSMFHQNYYGKPFAPNTDFYQKDLDHWGSHPKTPNLMANITIESVQAKVNELLDR